MGRSVRRRLAVCLAAATVALGSGALLSPAGADTASSAEVQQALARLNVFRADYGTPPAVDDPGMDAGAAAHANYMALAGALTHTEVVGSNGYTPAGAAAGGCGDEAENDSLPAAIDAWMRAPLHALIELGTFGDVTLGLGRTDRYESLTCADGIASGSAPVSQPPSFPVTYPGYGGTLPFFTFGGESPDPRGPCAGQGLDPGTVSGFGLLASFGSQHGPVTNVSATLTPDGGSPVPVCVVDEANTTDPADSTAHGILSIAHSVVVFPRDALQPSTSYTWTTDADGATVTRRFTTSATDAGSPPPTGTITTIITTTTTTTVVSSGSAGGSAAAKTKPGCTLTSPLKIARSHGKVKLTTVQKCHGEKGKAKILIQRHQGKKWITVASPAAKLDAVKTSWSLTIKAAHNTQFRWVLQFGKKTLATSRTTVAS